MDLFFQDNLETSTNTVERLTRQNHDLAEENRNLHREYEQIKEMYRREVERLEESCKRSEKLLNEYKSLFSQMSRRCDTEREQFSSQKRAIVVGFNYTNDFCDLLGKNIAM